MELYLHLRDNLSALSLLFVCHHRVVFGQHVGWLASIQSTEYEHQRAPLMRFFVPLTTLSYGYWGSYVPGIPTPAPSAFRLSQPLDGLLIHTTCLSCFIQTPSMGFKELGGEFQNHSRLRRLPGASAVSYWNGLSSRTATCVVVCVVRLVAQCQTAFSRIGVNASAIWHATHQSDLQANPAGRRAAPYRHVRLQPYPTQKPTHLTTQPRDLHALEQPTCKHLSMPTSTTWFVTELSHNVQLSPKSSWCPPASR